MPREKPAITLQERPGSIFETHKRYDVLLDGKTVDELYYNLTGYVGSLPTPEGQMLGMPECSIGAFRKEIAALNREFKERRRHQ